MTAKIRSKRNAQHERKAFIFSKVIQIFKPRHNIIFLITDGILPDQVKIPEIILRFF